MEDIKKEKLFIFILASAQIAHIIDFVIMMPLGPVLMEDFGIGPTKFASLVSSYSFSAAFVGILFSVIADSFDRKLLLNISFVGFIISTFLCSHSSNFIELLMARIFTGCFGGLLTSLIMAIVTELIPFERRGRALSVVMSSFSVASVIGIPIGLAISDYYGWRMSFLAIGVYSIFVGVGSFFILPKMKSHIEKIKPKEVLLGFVRLFKNKEYITGFSLIFVLGFSTFSLVPFFGPFSVKNIGIATTDLKYLYMVGGFFTVITARVIGKLTDQYGAFNVYKVLGTASIVPIYLYTSAGPMSLGWYLCLTTFFMTIISGRVIPCMTLVTTVPELKDRGAYMGLLNSLRSLGTAIATLVSGMIIIENSDGTLSHFNYLGYFSMLLVFVTIPIALSISKKIIKYP